MARTKRVLLRVAVALVLLSVAAIAVGLWWVSSLHHSEQADLARANAAFAEIRAQFAGGRPALEIRADRLVVVRDPPATLPSPKPSAAYMMTWEPDARRLDRLRLPFSISVVATEPIPLEALTRVAHDGVTALMQAKRRGDELNLRLSDLERYGRALLLDGATSDGTQILIWVE